MTALGWTNPCNFESKDFATHRCGDIDVVLQKGAISADVRLREQLVLLNSCVDLLPIAPNQVLPIEAVLDWTERHKSDLARQLAFIAGRVQITCGIAVKKNNLISTHPNKPNWLRQRALALGSAERHALSERLPELISELDVVDGRVRGRGRNLAIDFLSDRLSADPAMNQLEPLIVKKVADILPECAISIVGPLPPFGFVGRNWAA